YGTDESLKFLIDRSEASSWMGGSMPTETRVISHAGSFTITPQVMALLSICFHPSPKADEYLTEVLSRTDQPRDEAVSFALHQIEEDMNPFDNIIREQRAAWTLKQRGFRLNEEGVFVPLDGEEKSTAGSGTVASTSDYDNVSTSTRPETADVAPEVKESGWVMWSVLGAFALAVAGGFFVIFRRH
ncbi:MAG: hypothetical protein ACREIA_02485, partial [Opitutaceae bacterium]